MNKYIILILFMCLGLLQTKAQSTDISKFADVIYADNVNAVAGEQLTLSVKMKNTFEAPGFQFDLVLPQGFTVATDEDDMFMTELSTARTTAKKTNYFDSAMQPDGSFRVLCDTSAKNVTTGKLYVFSGNDGEVCTITINIDKSVVAGDYEIKFKDIEISDINSVGHTVDGSITSIITIPSSEKPKLKGDVNEDGVVDIRDVTELIDILLGKSS